MSVALILVACSLVALPGEGDYVAGCAAERDGKFIKAQEAFAHCAHTGGPLQAFAKVRAARCQALSGDLPGALASCEHVLAECGDGPWTGMAHAEIAAIQVKAGAPADAAQHFAHVTAARPHLWWLDRYEWQAAENLLSMEDTKAEAYAFFRNIVETAGFRKPRLDAAALLAESPSTEDRLYAALGLLRSGSYKDGGEALLRLAPALGSTTEDLSHWADLSRRILTGQADPADVAVVSDHEAAADKPLAIWLRLWFLFTVRQSIAKGSIDSARTACDRLVSDYPGSVEAGDALWLLAWTLARKDEPADAIKQYLRLVEQCPGHSRADDALSTVARLQLSLGQGGEALAIWKRLRERYPQSRYVSGACFESGRYLERSGNARKALEHYEKALAGGLGDYYAHRALERLHALGHPAEIGRGLKVDGRDSFVRPMPDYLEVIPETPQAMLDDPRMQRLFFFAGEGLDEGEWEILDLAQALPHEPTLRVLYQALSEAGLAYSARQLAEATGWGTTDSRKDLARRRLDYPKAYWRDVLAMAKETGVDPFLILAAARQESTFRPALVSSAGARGVMQVMPATAKWLAKIEPNISTEHAAHLEHPGNSLRLGAYYLMRMIDRSDGNLVYALASYNGGPGNCDKWRRRAQNADLDTFVESIPFSETRGYVKAVLGNYAAYHSLYPPTP